MIFMAVTGVRNTKPDIWKTAAQLFGRTLASPQGRDRLRLRGPGSSPTGSCTQGRDTW